MWKFDPVKLKLLWVKTSTELIESGEMSFGDGGDLTVDSGDRTNDSSVVDGGERIINGSV